MWSRLLTSIQTFLALGKRPSTYRTKPHLAIVASERVREEKKIGLPRSLQDFLIASGRKMGRAGRGTVGTRAPGTVLPPAPLPWEQGDDTQRVSGADLSWTDEALLCFHSLTFV